SNRADWTGWARLRAKDDGTDIDLSPLSIRMQVRRCDGHGYGNGYGGDWGLGAPVLSGSTDSGELTTPAGGILAWHFPASRLSALRPGLYGVGILMEDASGNRQQLFIGTVAIIEGGVF
ncbi:MAG TPA: hypothetical protein VIK69_04985, partial [Methylophilaceae bacterium]